MCFRDLQSVYKTFSNIYFSFYLLYCFNFVIHTVMHTLLCIHAAISCVCVHACVLLPEEYGSCLSRQANSFLSYLALIHCSRKSLWRPLDPHELIYRNLGLWNLCCAISRMQDTFAVPNPTTSPLNDTSFNESSLKNNPKDIFKTLRLAVSCCNLFLQRTVALWSLDG